MKPDDRRKPSLLPPRLEQAVLDVTDYEEAMRRERELRALFVQFIRRPR